jgi:hypothetical protein
MVAAWGLGPQEIVIGVIVAVIVAVPALAGLVILAAVLWRLWRSRDDPAAAVNRPDPPRPPAVH